MNILAVQSQITCHSCLYIINSFFHQIITFKITTMCFFLSSFDIKIDILSLLANDHMYVCIVCYIYTIFFCSIVKNYSFSYTASINLTHISSFLPFCLFVLHLFFHYAMCVWGWSSLQQTIRVQFSFLFFYFYVCETNMRYNKQNVYGNVYINFQIRDCVIHSRIIQV